MDSDWASLPAHLLDSVLKKLEPLEDYLQFSATCTKWNSVAKHNQSQRMKMLTHQIPMLLVPSENEHSHRVYNVVANNFSKSKLVVPYYKRYAGSSIGWLVACEEDFSVKLYKPFSIVEGETIHSNTTIHLPPLFPPEQRGDVREAQYHVFKACISADPLTNPDQCVVVAIFSITCKIAYIRPAKDTTWTCINDIREPAEEVLYFKDQFYALSYEGDLMSFKITEPAAHLNVELVAKRPRHNMVRKGYLVKSYGEEKLLYVRRYIIRTFPPVASEGYDGIFGRVKTKVIVYELDFENRRWFRIYSLGDLALFLGDNTSMCVLASNFSGCKRNCIYFTHDKDWLRSSWYSSSDFSVYKLATGKIEYYFGTENDDVDEVTCFPIWIVPTLNE